MLGPSIRVFFVVVRCRTFSKEPLQSDFPREPRLPTPRFPFGGAVHIGLEEFEGLRFRGALAVFIRLRFTPAGRSPAAISGDASQY